MTFLSAPSRICPGSDYPLAMKKTWFLICFFFNLQLMNVRARGHETVVIGEDRPAALSGSQQSREGSEELPSGIVRAPVRSAFPQQRKRGRRVIDSDSEEESIELGQPSPARKPAAPSSRSSSSAMSLHLTGDSGDEDMVVSPGPIPDGYRIDSGDEGGNDGFVYDDSDGEELMLTAAMSSHPMLSDDESAVSEALAAAIAEEDEKSDEPESDEELLAKKKKGPPAKKAKKMDGKFKAHMLVVRKPTAAYTKWLKSVISSKGATELFPGLWNKYEQIMGQGETGKKGGEVEGQHIQINVVCAEPMTSLDVSFDFDMLYKPHLKKGTKKTGKGAQKKEHGAEGTYPTVRPFIAKGNAGESGTYGALCDYVDKEDTYTPEIMPRFKVSKGADGLLEEGKMLYPRGKLMSGQGKGGGGDLTEAKEAVESGMSLVDMASSTQGLFNVSVRYHAGLAKVVHLHLQKRRWLGPKKVILFFGDSGSGKSQCANYRLAHTGEEGFEFIDTKGNLSDLNQQLEEKPNARGIVLNEFAGDCMKPTEFNQMVEAGSRASVHNRYHDAPNVFSSFIITSNIEPWKWWANAWAAKNAADLQRALYRRFTEIWRFEGCLNTVDLDTQEEMSSDEIISQIRVKRCNKMAGIVWHPLIKVYGPDEDMPVSEVGRNVTVFQVQTKDVAGFEKHWPYSASLACAESFVPFDG